MRAARQRVRREPADPHARELLVQAERGKVDAILRHKGNHDAAFMAALGDAPPQRSMSYAHRILRRGRRRTNQVPAGQGPTFRDWQREVDAVAGQPPPPLQEEPDPESPPPTARQLRRYADRMSKRTCPGPDGLSAELFQFAPDVFFEELARTIGVVWVNNSIPIGGRPRYAFRRGREHAQLTNSGS